MIHPGSPTASLLAALVVLRRFSFTHVDSATRASGSLCWFLLLLPLCDPLPKWRSGARLPQLAVDAWTLEVENLLGVRTPVRRNEVLRYAAALLLVRRWVALNRCGHSRASRYSRLPRDVAALGRMEFSGVFAYAAGGARAVEDTTVLNVLQCMKVNDEMFDLCAALFDSALAGAHSAQEAEWKAYVMARTSSRAAAGLQAFHASGFPAARAGFALV